MHTYYETHFSQILRLKTIEKKMKIFLQRRQKLNFYNINVLFFCNVKLISIFISTIFRESLLISLLKILIKTKFSFLLISDNHEEIFFCYLLNL